MALIKAYRFVWIRGRFGGGKTALSVELSRRLLRQTKANKLAANIPVAWGERDLSDVSPRDSVIIMDEGGLFWKTSLDFEMVASYLRKFNVFVLIPGVVPPNIKFRMLSIQRMLNLAPICGLQIWVYKWELREGAQDSEGYFGWAFPGIFDYYDTNFPPSDDAGIAAWVDAYAMQQVQSLSLYEKQRKQEEDKDEEPWTTPSGQLPLSGFGLRDATDTLGDAGERLGRSAKKLGDAARKL